MSDPQRTDPSRLWLSRIELSPDAAAHRRRLSVIEFAALQSAIEHLAMVTSRPIREVAERVLGGVEEIIEGHDLEPFAALLVDIFTENGLE